MHSKLCSLAVLVALTSSSACGSCGPVPVPVARGSASAAWSITTAGNVTTCARVGATSVSLLLHNRARGDDTLTSFACTDTQATTAPLPAGTYDATLALHASDGVTMTTAPLQAAITIAAGQVTALQPETFAADNRLGGLVLSIAPLTTAPTCLPRDQGGQGITGHVVELLHAAGGCAPVTFKRMRGSLQVGTYTVDCTAPQVAPCIERNETLQAIDSAPGPYAVSVSALAGTVQCGSGEDVVLVPANASATRPIQIAPVQTFGC
jgi:hypothetical protein